MENKFEIIGGAKTTGEIEVNGAKNQALKILAAVVLASSTVKIENFPFIEDTSRMLELLEELGAKVKINKILKMVEVDPQGIVSKKLDDLLVRKLRASILLAGPLLGKFGQVEMNHPGGCVIGKRPIDMFIDGFKKLGAKVKWSEDSFCLQASGGRLSGGKYFFPKITVTGTETMMLAAVLAQGETVLENCAMEPEIPTLAEFLNQCGAKINGAGTSRIVINGVSRISGGNFKVIPDRIEAGTFVMMGLLTGGELTVKNCIPEHLGAVIPILEKVGAKLEIGSDFIKTFPSKINAVSITTHEYPGFATDLQPPFTLLMTQAKGISVIQETIFEGRLFFTDQLVTMGADIIMCDPYRVVISGPRKLYGKSLTSPDLRAGITMVLAGMVAQGKTTIDNIYQIDRGYENIEERLIKVGVKIKRI